MITDKETNHIYFSQLIKEKEEYIPFWERLNPILIKNNISYSFIKNTRDIWCRDYMPLQIKEEEFVEFTYFPNYYLEPKYIAKLTIQEDVRIYDDINKTKSQLIIDGGNIIKSKTKAILTDRVFKDNADLMKKTIITELIKELKVQEVHIIPSLPYDITGHADGMLRFLDENTLLVADYSIESLTYQKKMKKALDKTGLQIIEFPYVHLNEKNKDGDAVAKGVYINFARVGDIVLFPQFHLEEDKMALSKAREIFYDCQVIPINCNEIAEDGGVLNCVTWNIKTSMKASLLSVIPSVPNFDDQEIYVYERLDHYISIFDYDFIASAFTEAWDALSGQLVGDGDFKYFVYRSLENSLPTTRPIPQDIVDEVVDLILDYLSSIGQWRMDLSEN